MNSNCNRISAEILDFCSIELNFTCELRSQLFVWTPLISLDFAVGPHWSTNYLNP